MALSVVFSSFASIRVHPRIGNVERVGVALESFCKAFCSSVLDVENFIEILSEIPTIKETFFTTVIRPVKIPKRLFL